MLLRVQVFSQSLMKGFRIMRKFALVALLLAGLTANAQAGSILNSLIVPGVGGNSLQDQSRGAVVHNGSVLSAATFSAGGASQIAVGDTIFGAIDLTNQQTPGGVNNISSPTDLIAIYSMTVQSVPGSGVGGNGSTNVVDFAPTTTGAYSIGSLVSPTLQAQTPGVDWSKVGVALIEGTFQNPIQNVTGLGGASALDVIKAIGSSYAGLNSNLTAISGAAKTLDLAIGLNPGDGFYQAALNNNAGPGPHSGGTQFGNIYAGLGILGNNTGIVFGNDVGQPTTIGQTQNQLTGATPGDLGVSISGGQVAYLATSTSSPNWTFGDSALANLDPVRFVPEPGSIVVWSVVAIGFGVSTFRRRKNAGK